MASFTSDVSQSLADKLREEILNKIEAVYASVTNAVINGAVPEFSFYSRASWECLSFSEETGVTLSADEKKMVRVRLDNKQSVKSFAYMTKVLNIMYKLVQEDKYCTKRDIYYQSPDVFGSQSVVDNVVDNVACMLEVPRWKLHVLATCKGLVAGDLQFYDAQGRHVDCNRSKMGVQIPAHDKDMLYLHTNAQLVIVVEKDATFQKLLTEDFCATFGRVILITGKGYPDVGTRLLVRKIWEQFKMPVFALVDGDPHGIEVMLVYKYGSKTLLGVRTPPCVLHASHKTKCARKRSCNPCQSSMSYRNTKIPSMLPPKTAYGCLNGGVKNGHTRKIPLVQKTRVYVGVSAHERRRRRRKSQAVCKKC
ncbi:meiotic recombination protein SPO11-like isoform X2 [Littorina saxatilis]|uniref:meiotic recombination protein SPO11-like isoform X2 n=1 Tax=Littorina saxatilis TaxID=31220 RepID=UPI0038B5DCFA